MKGHSVVLGHKPSAAIQVSSFIPLTLQKGPLSHTLVVFVNGLSATRTSWEATVKKFIALREMARLPLPALLAYDRYGQDKSDHDPTDGPDKPLGHDIATVISDMNHLIEHICENELQLIATDVRLILVSNAIGCAISRLYTATYPGRVEGLIFLDSVMANTDFASLLPDPDAPGFRALPGVTVESLKHARSVSKKYFSPTSPTRENLDQSALSELLPYADRPALPNGPDGRRPLLAVVGHDWDVFARESEEGFLGFAKPVTNSYLNPPWSKYNSGLTKIAECREVKIALGTGHFIQKDDPDFVALELNTMLESVLKRRGGAESKQSPGSYP